MVLKISNETSKAPIPSSFKPSTLFFVFDSFVVSCNELYEKALALNAKMSINFEKERKVLAAFRKGLKKMIDSREANLAALQAQLSKLESSMNRTEDPIQGLFKKMEVHLDVLKGACAQQQENAKVDVVEINKLVSLIQQHHVGVPGDAAAATGAEEQTSDSLTQ